MTFRTLIVALGTLCLIAVASGCGRDAGGPARVATAAECRVVPNGTQMTSPISNKEIVKQTATPAALYDGKLYFFCCAVDRDKFLQNPKLYSDGVLPPNGRIVEAD